jgi:hypothetical protein
MKDYGEKEKIIRSLKEKVKEISAERARFEDYKKAKKEL